MAAATIEKAMDMVLLEDTEILTSSEWVDRYKIRTDSPGYASFKTVYARFWDEGVDYKTGVDHLEELNADLDPEGDEAFKDGLPDESSDLPDEIETESLKHELEYLGPHEALKDRNQVLYNFLVDRATRNAQDPIPTEMLRRNIPNVKSLELRKIEIRRYMVRKSPTSIKDFGGYEHAKQHVAQKISPSVVKVNDYLGDAKYYVLCVKEDIIGTHGNEKLELKRGQVLSLALLYFLEPYIREGTEKAMAKFYYLAHFAADRNCKPLNVHPGRMLLDYLKEKVVQDDPLFLELDKKNNYESLRDYYQNNGFHKHSDIITSTDVIWQGWRIYLIQASLRAWTTIMVKGERKGVFSREIIFDKHTMEKDGDIWMVYWSKWEKKEEVVQLSESEKVLAVAAVESENNVNRPEVIRNEVMGVRHLACMRADEWLNTFSPRRENPLIFQKSFVEMYQHHCETILKKKPNNHLLMDEDYVRKFVEPGSQAGSSSSIVFLGQTTSTVHSIYDSVLRLYVLVAPNAGRLKLRDSEEGKTLQVGEPCAFALVRAMQEKGVRYDDEDSGGSYPRFLHIAQMGATTTEAEGTAMQSLFFKEMAKHMQRLAKKERRANIIFTNPEFLKVYGAELGSLGFISSSSSSKQNKIIQTKMGTAFAHFFQTFASQDSQVQFYENNGKLNKLFDERSTPMNSNQFLLYWDFPPVNGYEIRSSFQAAFQGNASRREGDAGEDNTHEDAQYPLPAELTTMQYKEWERAHDLYDVQPDVKRKNKNILSKIIESYFSTISAPMDIEYYMDEMGCKKVPVLKGGNAGLRDISENYEMLQNFWVFCTIPPRSSPHMQSGPQLRPYGFMKTYTFYPLPGKEGEFKRFSYIPEAYTTDPWSFYLPIMFKKIREEAPPMTEGGSSERDDGLSGARKKSPLDLAIEEGAEDIRHNIYCLQKPSSTQYSQSFEDALKHSSFQALKVIQSSGNAFLGKILDYFRYIGACDESIVLFEEKKEDVVSSGGTRLLRTKVIYNKKRIIDHQLNHTWMFSCPDALLEESWDKGPTKEQYEAFHKMSNRKAPRLTKISDQDSLREIPDTYSSKPPHSFQSLSESMEQPERSLSRMNRGRRTTLDEIPIEFAGGKPAKRKTPPARILENTKMRGESPPRTISRKARAKSASPTISSIKQALSDEEEEEEEEEMDQEDGAGKAGQPERSMSPKLARLNDDVSEEEDSSSERSVHSDND